MDGFVDPFGGEPTEPWDTDPAQTPEAYAAELERELDAETQAILGDKEVRWRAEQFALIGLNPAQSRRLALDRRVDLQKTRDLMKAGCAPDLAFLIMS